MSLLKQFVKNIFQYEARLILKKYKPKIIAITGSVGKTLTRDAVYSLLSKKFFVRKSQKSFTAELGVSLAIIGCSDGRGTILDWLKNIFVGFWLFISKNNYPQWLILEIDGDKPGDIEKISRWIRPDILVITAIGEVPSHIESFASNIDLFLYEKKLLINSLSPDGVILYNADDEAVSRLVSSFDFKKVSCGVGSDCQVFGSEYEVLTSTGNNLNFPTGMIFVANINGEKIPINVMETLGVSNEYATLLSFAVVDYLGLSSKDLASLNNKIQPSPGHMKIISGIKDTTILDDSYNSSPIAIHQASVVMSKIKKSGRKIFVMGDMLELGRFSIEEHKKVAKLLKDKIDVFVGVGFRTRNTIEELLSLGFTESNIFSFNNSYEAGNFLQNFVEAGDIILVKGSQDMRMERVVEEVMRHPEDKEKLLVRQEEEWLLR